MSAFKLEVGKFYKTADGRKVYIERRDINANPSREFIGRFVNGDAGRIAPLWNESGYFNAYHPEAVLVSLCEESNPHKDKRARAEELVRIVNDRLNAIHELLANHRDLFELRVAGGMWRSAPAGTPNVSEYRLKPDAPALPDPIRLIESGHRVIITRPETGVGLCAGIGCQSFDLNTLRSDLRNFKNGNSTHSNDFSATRHGLKYSAGQISWVDADQLLAYLEQVRL